MSGGGAEDETANDIVVDSQNNVFVTGEFRDKAVFGSTTLTSTGKTDIYLIKLSPTGALQWAISGGGKEDDKGCCLAVDTKDAIYLAGSVGEKAQFAGLEVQFDAPKAVIAKIDQKGNGVWIKSAKGDDESHFQAIAISVSNEIYLAGSYYKEFTFDEKTVKANNPALKKVFITKLDRAGKAAWVISSQGSSEEDIGGLVVSLDTNHLYMTGSFTGTVDLGSQKSTSRGKRDLFLLKLTTGGNLEWIRHYGGTGQDTVHGLHMVGNDGLLITGTFSKEIDFGGNKLQRTSDISPFIAKVDKAGKMLWVQSSTGTGSSRSLRARYGPKGDVHLVGDHQKGAVFGPYTPASNGKEDMLYLHFSTKGELKTLRTFGGKGVERGTAVTFGSDGSMYITGILSDKVQFGNVSAQSKGGKDAFVMRIAP